MPQAMVAVAQWAAATLTTVGFSYATAAVIVNTFAYATNIMLLSAASRKLLGKTGETRGMEVSLVDSTAESRVILGEIRCGGVNMIPPYSSGSDGQYLHQVLALCLHEIDSFQTYYFDQEALPTPAAISGTSGDGLISGSGTYKDVAWVRGYTGTMAQNVDYILNAAFPTQWPTTSRGRGGAYFAVKYDFGKGKVYRGVPPATVKLRGAKVYDPRLDSTNGGSGSHRYATPSTWAWSKNPALCWAFYRISASGFACDPATEIDWAAVAAAADICDAVVDDKDGGTRARYTCSGMLINERDSLKPNSQRLIDAMFGRETYIDGVHACYAGAWTAPSWTIEKADWLSIDHIQTVGGRDNGRYNAVHCFYVDPNRNWQRVECYPRRNATYKSDDAGEAIDLEMEQPLCTDESEAQMKAEFLLRASRNGIKLVGRLPPRFMKIKTFDVVALNFAELGFTSKTFRVSAMKLFVDGSVQVALTEEQEADWTDLDTADYNNPSLSPMPSYNPTKPSAPQNFTITPDFGLLKFDWDDPVVRPVGTVYRVLQSPGSHWIASSGTTLWEGSASDALVRVTNPASPFWYHVQAYAGSYESPFNPTTYGQVAYPYASPEGYRGNRLLPDGEFAAASNSYWNVAASSHTVNRTGGLGDRGYLRLWINNGAAENFYIKPKNVYAQDRMSAIGSSWFPATNGQHLRVQGIMRSESWSGVQVHATMYAGLFLSPTSYTSFFVGNDQWDVGAIAPGSYRSFVSSFDTNFNVNSPINAVSFIFDDNATGGTATSTMTLDVMQLQVTVS